MREITSASNPFVKHLQALASAKKTRQESNRFIIEGWRGIDTLLRHESRQYTLESLAISPEWVNDPRLPTAIETTLLPGHLMEKISDVRNTQGILGVIHHTPYPFEFFPDTGRYLLLDNLRDPGNLGTLIRSAVGAGFDGILLFGECVELFNPKVIRSTMGTFAFASVWNVCHEEIDELLKNDYDLLAAVGHEGGSLYETEFGRKTVLAIGSEAHGLSDELLQRSTEKITIPLNRECESLNAAIAGSICMFYMTNKKG